MRTRSIIAPQSVLKLLNTPHWQVRRLNQFLLFFIGHWRYGQNIVILYMTCQRSYVKPLLMISIEQTGCFQQFILPRKLDRTRDEVQKCARLNVVCNGNAQLSVASSEEENLLLLTETLAANAQEILRQRRFHSPELHWMYSWYVTIELRKVIPYDVYIFFFLNIFCELV
jgi:hypothetical protein